VALAARLIAYPTCGRAGRTLNPILFADSALVRTFASLSADHAPALPIGKLYVIAGCSTYCARRDWLRTLHATRKEILSHQSLRRLCLILFDFAGHPAWHLRQAERASW
jgi:hypothetical protein